MIGVDVNGRGGNGGKMGGVFPRGNDDDEGSKISPCLKNPPSPYDVMGRETYVLRGYVGVA